MKLINLLIRELNNCIFESRAMHFSTTPSISNELYEYLFNRLYKKDICQFYCFSSEINFKRVRSYNYGIPILGSSKNILYHIRPLHTKIEQIAQLDSRKQVIAFWDRVTTMTDYTQRKLNTHQNEENIINSRQIQ